MVRLKKRPAIIVVSLLASLCLLASYALWSGAPASGAPDASLGPLSPNRSSSDPTGAHTFLMRKNNLGKNTQLQISAYYPVDTNWGQEYIYIDPYLTCDVDFDSDTQAGPVTYMRVAIEAGGVTDTYRIKIDKQTGLNNVCNVTSGRVNDVADNNTDKNKLFARYPLPGSKPLEDNGTKLLKVTVEIAYESIVTTPVKSDTNNNQQRFQVRAQTKAGGNYSDNNSALLGPTGGNDGGIADSKFNFPVMGRPENYGQLTQISVPFGLPCNATNSQIKSVGVYDSDNFAGAAVRFRVKDLGDGDSAPTHRVYFNNGQNPKPGTPTSGWFDNVWFTPNQDNKDRSSVDITMEPDHQYQIEVINIDGGNTIVINVPTETIFGVIRCGWKMRPDSAVNPSVQQPGSQVTFTHTATNVGKFKSDPVTSKVKWGKTGQITTGTIFTDTDREYNPANNTASKTWSNNFTIPTGALDGWEYCQYLEVKPHSKKDSNAYDSWMKGDRACVRVQGPPPTPAREVGVQPVVNGQMEYIEPTETARFDGYVNITGFPQLWADEWGYTEVAKQRPAQRVTATGSSGLQVDGPYFTSMVQTSPGSTTYYCPHGNDTKISQSTCRHDRPSYTTKDGCEAAGFTWGGGSCKSFHSTSSSYTPPTYACPATYQPISSSTCWRYRYKCAYDSSWGAWNGPAPNCMTYWTCPGGAAGSGWSYSAPSCQGWRCQYAPYTQVNQATAPPCEYRCTDGTGIRAPQSNGWTGDMNCYIAPSFTLTCFWKNKPAFSQTVTSNGRYCDNRDMDADEVGVTIGTPVRAVLTANYPGTNAWSFPPPGYKINTLVTRWGWNNFPSRSAEDTVRVVAKPTVKIRGGDVAAGGRFKDTTNCNLTPTFSTIGGWPHSPVYDASGTQFAATASGNVWGFATATHRGTPRSTPPSALAFSNTSLPSGDHFGRQFTSRMPCLYDHYGMKPATLPSLDLNNITGAESGSYTGTGGQISNNPILQPGKRVTVYVDGNVYISNQNIRYNRSAPWTKTQDIPGFKLVVRGNIYIAPSVRELNGIYVAQPTSPTSTTTGNIYTCATATAPVSPTSRYGTCNTDLTVNGTFLARKVYLDRTQGTAIRGETAEYFNYLPELWLTNWETTDSSSELKYDSIISLPPVL